MALKEIFAKFGVAVDDSGLKKLDAGVSGMTGKLQALGAALAGGAIVGGLRSMIHATAEAGAEINDSALRLGFATDELQVWRYAAKLAGVSAEGLEGALQKLNLAADNAKQGAKPQVQAFKALGVSFKDAQGNIRPTADLLPEIADGLAKIGDPAKQSGLAVDLLGRSGVKLLPLLKEGAAGLEKYRGELTELGGIMSSEAIEQADEYGDNIDRLDFALAGLRNTLVLQVLPAVTGIVDKVSKAVAWTGKLVEKTNILRVAGGLLATAAGIWGAELAIAYGPTLALAAALAGVVLAVEDFYTLMTGGKSVIGDFLDEMKPLGLDARDWVEGITLLWQGFIDVLRTAGAVASDTISVITGGEATQVKAVADDIATRDDKKAIAIGEAQKKAVRDGDSKAFEANGGQFEAFKARRLEFLNWYAEHGQEVPTEGKFGGKGASDLDRGTFGALLKAPAGKVQPSASASAKAGNTVNGGAVTVNVTVPSGTSREQALAIGKIARQEMERANRAAHVALRQEAL